MKLPAVLREQLSTQMKAAGIPLPETEARWLQAEQALIGVWASKFNDRAYFSMRKVGLNFMDLRMAVLVQRVVPADYAFVIHTVNPSSGAPSPARTPKVEQLRKRTRPKSIHTHSNFTAATSRESFLAFLDFETLVFGSHNR